MVLFDVMLDVLFVDVGLWLFDFGVVDGDCWCVIGELVQSEYGVNWIISVYGLNQFVVEFWERLDGMFLDG